MTSDIAFLIIMRFALVQPQLKAIIEVKQFFIFKAFVCVLKVNVFFFKPRDWCLCPLTLRVAETDEGHRECVVRQVEHLTVGFVVLHYIADITGTDTESLCGGDHRLSGYQGIVHRKKEIALLRGSERSLLFHGPFISAACNVEINHPLVICEKEHHKRSLRDKGLIITAYRKLFLQALITNLYHRVQHHVSGGSRPHRAVEEQLFFPIADYFISIASDRPPFKKKLNSTIHDCSIASFGVECRMNRRFISTGHLIDSGILSSILNLIIEEGADYEIIEFKIGKTHTEESRLEIELLTSSAEQLGDLTEKLIAAGCYEKSAAEAEFTPALKDRCAPEDFYSTTNHRTEIYSGGEWKKVAHQRMDAAIVDTGSGLECRKLRDIKKGDPVLKNADSVRIFPPARKRQKDEFGFMSGEVSSERAADMSVERIARALKEMKRNNERVIAVAGPVVVHTGGAPALAALIDKGYISGLLAGNAIAVHDIESQLYGTSLGVDLKSGRPTHEGHKNHMKAINRIYKYGSIKQAVEAGELSGGLMHTVIKTGIPYCLAGSIRDDGPLPETENDMIKAQAAYADIICDASAVLMLSTMLHSIGTGNMLPSWVTTVCVDINPAVVTKLADRGSGQAIGIVSDVGLFLNRLADRLL